MRLAAIIIVLISLSCAEAAVPGALTWRDFSLLLEPDECDTRKMAFVGDCDPNATVCRYTLPDGRRLVIEWPGRDCQVE